MADTVHPLDWIYLLQFDAYYMIHGDTNIRILKCLEGTEEPNGSMVIRYEPDSAFYGTQGDFWQVKLELSGEEWKILSNVCLERTVNLYHPDATIENFVQTEARISGTPQSIVDALIELGALPEGTRVNKSDSIGIYEILKFHRVSTKYAIKQKIGVKIDLGISDSGLENICNYFAIMIE